MTTSARLVVAAIALAALTGSAMARTHHAPVHHGYIEFAAPPAYNPALPRDYQRYDGWQHDRQIVGLYD